MGAEKKAPVAPNELPSNAVDVLDRLDEEELRAAIDYAQERRQYIHPDVSQQIKPRPGEEILRIKDYGIYTEVVKRQSCWNNCEDCPHGPFLYHVREESRPEGGASFHWTYIGRVPK